MALNGGDDDGEQVSISEPLENLNNFQLIYAHPEALVENKEIMKLLKTTEFQRRVRAIVVDEAHLVVEWYVCEFYYHVFVVHVGFLIPVLLDTSISCFFNFNHLFCAE